MTDVMCQQFLRNVVVDQLTNALLNYVTLLEKAGEPLKALRVLLEHPSALAGVPLLVDRYKALLEKVRHAGDFNEYVRRYKWDDRVPLSDPNVLTLPRMGACIEVLSKINPKSVVSVGPATGEAEDVMLSNGVERLHLIDINSSVEKLVQVLKERHPLAHITFEVPDGFYNFKFKERLEVVWCLEVLEHVPSPSKLLTAIKDMGEQLLLSTPDATFWFEPGLADKPVKWYHHLTAHSATSLHALLQDVGFSVESISQSTDGSLIVSARPGLPAGQPLPNHEDGTSSTSVTQRAVDP